MAGRPNIEIYHYDTKENNYKYLGKFTAQVEVFNMYYDGKKGRLFNSNPEYRRLPDGTYVTKKRTGRSILPELIRKYEDPLNIKRKGDRVIELYNNLGEKIGELLNHRVLEAITKTPIRTFQGHLITTMNISKSHFGIPFAKFSEEVEQGGTFESNYPDW